MSQSGSSSSASAAASSRKRAPSPAAMQSADADAAAASALQPQPTLLSSFTLPPQKRARKSLLPARAFRGDVRERALAHAKASCAPAPVAPRWSDLSPAQRCFADGLALAFSFLSLAELIRASSVCNAWLASAAKANIAPASLNNPSFGSVSDLLRWRLVSSPFRRHVHAITHNVNNMAINGHEKAQTAWTIRGLAELGKMTQLRRISRMHISTTSTGRPKSTAAGCAAFRFPSLLESADLFFEHDNPLSSANSIGHGSSGSAELCCVLRALRPCHSLTELSITLCVPNSSELELSSLLEVVNLQILTIDVQRAGAFGVGSRVFTEDQIGVIKQLAALRRLTLLECCPTWLVGDPLMTDWPRWLCSAPHRLQRLQELDLSWHILQLEHMELLQRLPALTALEPAAMHESSLPLLPAFANRLRRLRLRVVVVAVQGFGPELFDFDIGHPRASFFLPHLTPCSRLTQLTLSKCVFNDDEASTLCLALPELRELALCDVVWPSFRSLRHLSQLESLKMERHYFESQRSLLLEAAHVTPLTRLRYLSLIRVLMQPLTGATSALLSALHPPSAVLPALSEFVYLA